MKEEKIIDKDIDDINVSWNINDENELKKKFNLSMEEEVKHIMKDINEEDGTVYKKKNEDGTESVSHVVINEKKKKNVEILENVPEELKDGKTKILLG